MKSQNAVAKARSTPTMLSQPDTLGDETARHAPTPKEIRQRAFEIHIEHGGICGCDMDGWLRAEREIVEKYKTSEGAKGK